MDIITNIIGGTDKRVCSFDLNEEIRRHEPWTVSYAKNKEMLDIFIRGGEYRYRDSRGEQVIDFGEGLYRYRNNSFIEDIGEYAYDSSTNSNKVYKRVIIYTLQD